MTVDETIDRFVEMMNRSPQEQKSVEEVPVLLREGDPDQFGWCAWKIRRVSQTPWIDALEAKLPVRLPPSFYSLVKRYCFPLFELGPLTMLSNTGEDIRNELARTIFEDEHLSPLLLTHGYVQFARPNTGDYDPICFDSKRRTKNGEMPIVRIDHEEVLCNSKIAVTAEIAKSFLELVEREIVT